MEKIIEDIEKIQSFIEEKESKDSKGKKINDFSKLCFVQEDLTKIRTKFNNLRNKIHNVIDEWDLKTIEKMQLEQDILKLLY